MISQTNDYTSYKINTRDMSEKEREREIRGAYYMFFLIKKIAINFD